jgi:peptide/nickel transport system permease protein
VAPSSPRITVQIPAAPKKPGPLRVLFQVLYANPLTFVGFLLVAFIGVTAAAVAIAPNLVVPFGALQNTGVYYSPPNIHHPFGTDGTGLDIFSNVLRALPLDLGISFFIAGVALLAGGGLGLVAGFWDRPGTISGAVSVVILRITDIFLAFPSLILALAISVSLGRGVWQTILAVLITWWPYYVRLVRGETLAVKHLPYIMAARAAGVTDGRIVLRHVVRNVLEPVIVYFTLDIGTVLVTFSTIGFVANAIPYPSLTPEWGSMLSYYQQYGLILQYPWLIYAPGVAIFVTVLAFSLLGDGLRDILDPRSRRAMTRATSTHEAPPEAPSGTPPDPGNPIASVGDAGGGPSPT